MKKIKITFFVLFFAVLSFSIAESEYEYLLNNKYDLQQIKIRENKKQQDEEAKQLQEQQKVFEDIIQMVKSGKLKNVTVPNGVTSIGNGLFKGCICLQSIIIPNTVTSIGNDVFSYCRNLTDISFEGSKVQWKEICKDKNLANGKILVDKYKKVTMHFNSN